MIAPRLVLRALRRAAKRVLPLAPITCHAFIVGAQKAGTSALHAYLARHPGIVTGENKELAFFSRDSRYARGATDHRNYFPLRVGDRIALDSTPEYLYYPWCAERIRAYAPDARLVVLLREPVERAHSAFNMYQQVVRQRWFGDRLRQATKETLSFFAPFIAGEVAPSIELFLERELELIAAGSDAVEPSLVRRGLYAPQLARLYASFPKSQVLVLFAEDLRLDPATTVARALSFLDLPPLAADGYPAKHARVYTTPVTVREIVATRAGGLFAADRAALSEHFGLEVRW